MLCLAPFKVEVGSHFWLQS